MPQSEPDVFVENHGSVCIVQPMSEAAREWIDENVQTKGWQWICGGLGFEMEARHRVPSSPPDRHDRHGGVCKLPAIIRSSV
jgi:hypothetical protein